MPTLTTIPAYPGSSPLPAMPPIPSISSSGTALNNGCTEVGGAMVCPPGSVYNAGIFGAELAKIQNWFSSETSGSANAGLAPKSGSTSSCSGWFCPITDWFKARGLDAVGGIVGLFIVMVAIYVLVESLSGGKLSESIKAVSVA